MYVGIFLFFLLVGILLLISSFFINSLRIILGVSGGFLLLLSGLFILVFGVDIPTGQVIVEQGNTYTIQHTYESIKGGLNSYGLSYVLFLLGFGGILISILYAPRRDNELFIVGGDD